MEIQEPIFFIIIFITETDEGREWYMVKQIFDDFHVASHAPRNFFQILSNG